MENIVTMDWYINYWDVWEYYEEIIQAMLGEQLEIVLEFKK